MSTPNMKGFKTSVAYSTTEIIDTDTGAFLMPVVEPGGDVINENSFWYNFGYAYLYNGQLSLVVGGTFDKGADADTLDVMQIKQSGGWILAAATPANSSNTSTWGIPIADPFRPFVDYFRAGIRWHPPVGAATGIIRKCFQWDGSYYPDTWDYVWYPLGNGYFPDNALYSDPMQISGTTYGEGISPDAHGDTGYVYAISTSSTYGKITIEHSLAGDPWAVNINNATGYVIEFDMESVWPTGAVIGIELQIEDGTYQYDVEFNQNGQFSGSGFTVPFVGGAVVGWDTFRIEVQGTAFELFRNGVSIATAILNSGVATKKIIMEVDSTPFPGGTWKFNINYIKYFCGGPVRPVY